MWIIYLSSHAQLIGDICGLEMDSFVKEHISDRHHLDMKKVLNRELYDMGIRVKNLKETDFRAFALNVIFTINSLLP